MYRSRSQSTPSLQPSTSQDQSTTKPVIIVGAGYAGLVCAKTLRNLGIPSIIVEAQNYIGGRVKQLKGFVEWKDIELGSEFIHGETSIIKDMVDQNGWPCRLLFTWAQGDGETPEFPVGGGIGLYYFDKEKKLVRYDTEDTDIIRVNQLLWGLCKLKPAPGDRRTLEQYLRDNGASERVLSLAESGYANTLCASLSELSLEGVAHLEASWDKYGGGDYRLDDSLSIVTDSLSEDLDIRTEWPVKSINYTKDDTVIVNSVNGASLEASKVVVTVPISILKDGDITFDPPLPESKKKAIKSIGYNNCVKIVMKFSKKFWPGEVHGVVCADGFIPELWFDEPSRPGVLTPQSRPVKQQSNAAGQNTVTTIVTRTIINNDTGQVKTEKAVVTTGPAITFTVSGYASSKYAEKLSNMPQHVIIENMLQQLDNMFANNVAQKLVVSPKEGQTSTSSSSDEEEINWGSPASSCFMDCLIYDWGKNPYIKGAYSFPSPGATVSEREELGKPIDDRIYFAGEATNPKSFMTMQGAAESGQVVAESIIESLGLKIPDKEKEDEKDDAPPAYLFTRAKL